MTSLWVPALAGLLGLAFALHVAHRWRHHPTSSNLHWALGLGLFALASFLEAWAAHTGWTPWTYRVYFPAAAGLVGLLGAGTIHLARPRTRLAHTATILTVTLLAVAALGPLTIPLETTTPVGDPAQPLNQWGPELGSDAVAFPHPARVAFLLLNVLGGLALVGGALASWWTRRETGVLLIGLGALLPFTGGSLSTLGIADARLLAQAAGVAMMYGGFLATLPPR